MIFAHIPAGYLLANVFVKHRGWLTWLLWVGMIGGTFPDIDILFDVLRQRDFMGHHISLMHFPVFWSLLAAIALILILLSRRKRWLPIWGVFFSAVFLHLILDTLVGGMYWLAPLSWTPIHLITIPTQRAWWVADFVLHWSFVFEVAIIASAAIVFFRGGCRELFELQK
jgi:hypothetical protein